jgi:hypothetical protein
MKGYILGLFFLINASYLLAQRDNVSLLVQSPDGKTVKLVWFFKGWNSDITGFDIKRKDGLQDWVKLNSEPILPEISIHKKISVVEPDKGEESRVKAKLYKLLSGKKIQAIDNAEFLQKLNNDEKEVQTFSEMISRDYDLALMSGFGYIDGSVTKKTNYEYGLFIQGTNILLDSVLWNYGEIPDLNVVKQITSKANPGINGIQLIWEADLDKMKRGDIVGFNIYREGIRLNSSPVLSAGDDPLEFTWDDKSANSEILNQYSISAESLFGIEGIIKSYTYKPVDHPEEYEKAEITDVASLGFYFKEGISIKWNFPKDYLHFIKGFYVEKDNIPGGFKTVSGLLDTSVNSFVDKTHSPVTGYIRFRVNVLYNDKTLAKGIERIYNYFPVREPPAPLEFKGKVATETKKISIYFSWHPTISGDTITSYYRIYDYDTLKNSFFPITDDPIKANRYYYTIEHGTAAMHRFYIASIGKNNTESQTSDTILVYAPSFELPTPEVYNSFNDNNMAVIKWNYPSVSDLKGFRLYQNKNLVANEDVLSSNTREFKTPPIDGGSYEYTIRAVSATGVLSANSTPVTVTIPQKRRR